MSTKKIREALLSHGLTHDVSEALREVEAIERAAKVIDENVKIPAIPADLEPALRLMERIAKEAP